MSKTKKIKCPKCGKVCGELERDHISIKKAGLLVYGADAMPKKCPKCGELFDMMKIVNGNGGG